MKTPSKVPSTLPRPPVSMVPPMTTAVIEPRLNPSVRDRTADTETTYKKDGSDRRQDAHQAISKQDHPRCGQSYHGGRLRITAEGIDLPTETRIGEYETDRREQQHGQGHANRYAERTPVGEEVVAVGNTPYRRQCIEQRQTLKDRSHAERHDQGVDTQGDDKSAGYKPDDRAEGEDANDNRHDLLGVAVYGPRSQ